MPASWASRRRCLSCPGWRPGCSPRCRGHRGAWRPCARPHGGQGLADRRRSCPRSAHVQGPHHADAEQRTGRTADEGLALFVARFQPEYPQQAINHILLGLGYFDDVDPDDALPVARAQIVDYWTRRQREIVTARGRLPTWTSLSAKPRRPIGPSARATCVVIVCTADCADARMSIGEFGGTVVLARFRPRRACRASSAWAPRRRA